MSEKELQELEEISSFNVSARYEEYKSMIYKKATREYTMKWIKIGEKYKKRFLEEVKKYE